MRKKRRVRRNENGQILILGLIVLIILLIGIFFLFDISTIIRSKIKSQTALDSASLAGANWQRYSMNMIGELNMLKATVMLVDDIPPFGMTVVSRNEFDNMTSTQQENYINTQIEEIQNSCESLSEMQARISFIGPLMGFAAAQQTAKNNGLPISASCNEILEIHLELLEDEDLYGIGNPSVPEYIQGYDWRSPYILMITSILEQGVAVNVNNEALNAPWVFSNADDAIEFALNQSEFYDAVNSRYWCSQILRNLTEIEFGSASNETSASNTGLMDGQWWGTDLYINRESATFVEESEYIPLGIDYITGSYIYNEADRDGILESQAQSMETDLIMDDFDEYDPDESGDTDVKIYPLPHITWAVYNENWGSTLSSDWTDAEYLRTPLQEGYEYLGSATAMNFSHRPSTITGYWGYDGTEGSIDSGSSMGDEMAYSDRNLIQDNSFEDYARRVAEAEEQIAGSKIANLSVTSLAKPLGRLTLDNGGHETPDSINMILPIFTDSIVMPLAMDPRALSEDMDANWVIWKTKCLPEIDNFSSLSDFSVWVRSEYGDEMNYYLAALSSWGQSSFRQAGREWLDTPVSEIDDGNGNIITIYREDQCDYNPPGGSAPDGPSRLF